MNIVIGYPPTSSDKGIALLSQNRQFQWFSHETRIFPVVLASAATMLQARGHQVTWADGIAEGLDEAQFDALLEREKPDLFVFETKTPVVRLHWQTIARLKQRFPAMKIALLGDHVTALPEETMAGSPVDFVVCGGHFDFAVAALVEALEKKSPMPNGVFYREGGAVKGNKNFAPTQKLDDAPFIDRDLTKWQLYEKEYNLQGHPFMYIMSGRDCWHGRCTFCAWTVLYPKFGVRSVKNVLDEIGMLIDRYGVKEIFDDSGTLTTGQWLRDLCQGLIDRGYSKKIVYSCNMRFGVLKPEDFVMMKKANFRLLKFGLESANQATLDRLDKRIKVEDITQGCRWAKQAGLTVHLTMIVGFPWETREDALRTFDLAKKLMQSGDADLLQATTVVPYPGTPLHQWATENDGFLFDPKAYERFDMSEPVLKTPMKPEEVREICNRIYSIFLTPSYIWMRIRSLKSWADVKFVLRGAFAVFGHIRDFWGKKKAA